MMNQLSSFYDEGPHFRNGLDYTKFDALETAFNLWRDGMRLVSDYADAKQYVSRRTEEFETGVNLDITPTDTVMRYQWQQSKGLSWERVIYDLDTAYRTLGHINSGDSFQREIESNLLSIDSENKGVLYCKKLTDFYNRIFEYAFVTADQTQPKGHFTLPTFNADLRLIRDAYGRDHEGYDSLRLVAGNFEFIISDVANVIIGSIKRTVWYKQHSDILTFREHAKPALLTSTDQEPLPVPAEPGVKLQWNGTSDSLYDLIAQLSLQNVTSTKPLLGNTIEGLARFLTDHVEGMPSVETIERRIRAFREPQGQTPKRGRIELHINKEKP